MLSEKDGAMDLEIEGIEQLPLQLPAIGSDPKKRKRPAPMHDFARARSNLRNFSKGIWKPPAQYRQPLGPSLPEPPTPELPPKQTTDQLLHSYYASSHSMFPILHWPTFQQGVEELYKPGGPQNVQPTFLSMFFAALAVGSLFTTDPHRSYLAAELAEASRKLIDPWNNDYVLDDVRTLVFLTMFLNEMNLKSAAWNWLGNAVQVAQDIGLYSESGPWPVIEGEMRCRVWWTIYILDRSLAVELGRPVLIDDSDCDVSLPAGVDDHYIHDGGMLVPTGAEPLTHSLLAVIHVVRSYTALNKALSSPVIAPTRLATFDSHFVACLRTFPPACDPSSQVSLSPHLLNPLIYLLHARLILHRHNLTPSCPDDVRIIAIEQCTHTALETASLLARTNSTLPEGATALLITHVFRCTLFLLLTGYFDAATTCIRALAAINGRRDVTMPCGRFFAFFVGTLASKRAEHAAYIARTTPPGQPPFAPPPRPIPGPLEAALLRDEELLAYVSADLQAGPDAAWVWAGGEREVPTAQIPSPGMARSGPSGAGGSSSASSLLSQEARTGLTEDESRDWGGWERVDSLVRGLASGTSTPTAQSWGPPILPPVKIEPGTGSAGGSIAGEGSSTNSPTAAGKSRNQERISIANII